MSYLHQPRFHFKGRFQADTSTINNDVRHYKSDSFKPQFQAQMVGQGSGEDQRTNGYWNPEGSGAWRMLGCRVTGATLNGQLLTQPSADAVIGLRLGGSDSRVAGKLVDLDPQQQLVSQIWGLQFILADGMGNRLLEADFEVSPFIDLWKRQQVSQNFDQTLAASYQSRLIHVRWGKLSGSPLLQALKAASEPGLLSIRFNVFGFDRAPDAPDYSTGVVIGTIGPSKAHEPAHFTVGRQMVPLINPGFMVPTYGVGSFQCVVRARSKVLTADFGNCLPIVTAAGDLLPIGDLWMGVARDVNVEHGACIDAQAVALLGPVPYQNEGWAEQTAGIVDFPFHDKPDAAALLADHPLVLLQKAGSTTYRVLNRESIAGLFVRADNYVFRLNPGEQAIVDLWASRYGKPAAMDVRLGLIPSDQTIIGGAGTGATLNAETWPIPDVAQPPDALLFPGAQGDSVTVQIDSSGRGHFTIAASPEGPGTPRGYLDGQVYALGYTIVNAPANYVYSPWYFLSVLLWDLWEIPATPTWFRDILPIFEQYGNLYPIMSRHFIDLRDYDSVVKHVRILKLAFSLPITDPNHMPVSRDLSAAKRAGILQWLDTPGSDGLPIKGQPEDRPSLSPPRFTRSTPPRRKTKHLDPGGKLDFVNQVIATHSNKAEPS